MGGRGISRRLPIVCRRAADASRFRVVDLDPVSGDALTLGDILGEVEQVGFDGCLRGDDEGIAVAMGRGGCQQVGAERSFTQRGEAVQLLRRRRP